MGTSYGLWFAAYRVTVTVFCGLVSTARGIFAGMFDVPRRGTSTRDSAVVSSRPRAHREACFDRFSDAGDGGSEVCLVGVSLDVLGHVWEDSVVYRDSKMKSGSCRSRRLSIMLIVVNILVMFWCLSYFDCEVSSGLALIWAFNLSPSDLYQVLPSSCPGWWFAR